MQNTKGNVALTNISREKNYFHDFVQYTKKIGFPQPWVCS